MESSEPLFVNSCAYSMEVLKTVMRCAQKRTSQYASFAATALLIAIGLMFAITDGEWFVLIIGIVFLCLNAFILFAIPLITAKSAYNQNLVMYKGEILAEMRIYDDHIISVNTNAGGEARFEYHEIARIMKTAKLIILFLPHKLVLPLARDGFTVGDEAGFMEFITQRTARK